MTTPLSRILIDCCDVAGRIIWRPGRDLREEIIPLEAVIRDMDDRLINITLTERAALLMKYLRKHSLETPGGDRARDWLILAEHDPAHGAGGCCSSLRDGKEADAVSASSTIEWTDASWTPIRARNLKTGKIGWHCEHATTGCEFCYAEGMNKRLGTGLPFKPGHRKDIEIFLDEKILTAPLRWKRPRMIFVCSMTDAFAEFVKDEWLDKIFAVMALCPQHTFQVLTKRPERMRGYLTDNNPTPREDRIWTAQFNVKPSDGHSFFDWPLSNVWLGTSCEDQETADERIPHLLNTPAAIRFVSAEPLLGPIDLVMGGEVTEVGHIDWLRGFAGSEPPIPHLDWVIVGGESGPRARPMHPQWARDIRDQCAAAGVAFFFKQWGMFVPEREPNAPYSPVIAEVHADGSQRCTDFGNPEGVLMAQCARKPKLRTLDGVEHSAFPEIAR